MDEIPKPEMLNPDRVNRDEREHFTAEDHRSQARLLATALGDSCAYADQLWQQLDAVRAYLLDSLPPDPHDPDAVRRGATPTGPDDEPGWEAWMRAFATTSSVLCGPHGDSGLGLTRARQLAQLRRVVPEPGASDAGVVEGGPDQDQAPPADEPRPPSTTASPGGGDHLGAAGSGGPTSSPALGAMKAVGAVVVAVLALRGLRPRRVVVAR